MRNRAQCRCNDVFVIRPDLRSAHALLGKFRDICASGKRTLLTRNHCES